MDNMEIWEQVNRPPKEALKPILGGRLKGKTDISPMWRIQKATELWGPIGIGWNYRIDKQWVEVCNDEICCFVNVSVKYKVGDDWSEWIPGTGGSKIIEKESKGLHVSDEGYKMALTDALSVCLKALGFGADIYFGRFDGSKYKTVEQPTENTDDKLTLTTTQSNQLGQILTAIDEKDPDFRAQFLSDCKIVSVTQIKRVKFEGAKKYLEEKLQSLQEN